MANRLQPKQIEDYKIYPIGVSGFSAAGTSDDVTTALTTTAATDGVPVQVSSTATTQGYKTTGSNNKVAFLVDSVNKQAIDDGLGNEVYGRLTEAVGVYTLSYFSLQGGVETAVSLSATSVDFFVNYNYAFNKIPNDANVRARLVVVGDDPKGQSGRTIRNETLTITGLNTFASPTLAKTPIAGSVAIFVNKVCETEGVGKSFTRVGKVLTWNATDAGYDLETTDTAVAHYNTLEA